MAYILENEYLKVQFDEKAGTLIGMLNKKTGWEAIRQPKLASGVMLNVPIKDHGNNRTLPDKQVISDASLDADKLVMRWDSLDSVFEKNLQIKTELTVELNGDRVEFSLNLDNNSEYVIEEVWCPSIGGLWQPEGEEQLYARGINYTGNMIRTPIGDHMPTQGYWGVDHPTFLHNYPGDMQYPFEMITNEKQGIYIGVHGMEIEAVNFMYELKPGLQDTFNQIAPDEPEIGGVPVGITASCIRLPILPPGESKTFDPVVVRMFEGTWQDGVDTYKEFRKTWHKLYTNPKWLGETECWMTLHINSPEGECRYQYSELPDLMREAKKAGVDTLQLIGWNSGGQDGNEPYIDFDGLLGTKEELKEAIRIIQDEIGIKVLLMCKFKWMDKSYHKHDDELLDHTIMDKFGDHMQFFGYSYQTVLEHLLPSIHNGYLLCHLSDGMRDIALRELDKILELEPAGLLYDESNAQAPVCFNGSHGHRSGDCPYKGSLILAKQFYERATQKNPEFILAGEGVFDQVSQYYPVWYVRTHWGDYKPGGRYLCDESVYVTCLTGFDDREMVNQCLAFGLVINFEPYNFKGRVSDFPLTVTYTQKCLALRKKLSEYLRHGKFLFERGATVSGDVNYLYGTFENAAGKKAVVVANQSRTDGSFCIKTEAASFKMYTPEDGEVGTTDGNVKIPARSMVVLVEE